MKRVSVSHFKLAGLTAGLLTCASWLMAQTPPPAPPSVALLATDSSALEGVSSGAFTLIRYGASDAALNVDLNISGSASNGMDYHFVTNVVTIPAGQRAVDIAIVPIADLDKRGNKTVVLEVKTNADYVVSHARRGVVTIVDDVFNTQPPTVAITSPTNGSNFAYPANVNIAVEAADNGATVRSVSIYANDDLLAKLTNSPYAFTWTNPPAGRYTLFARAVNDADESTLSEPVHISVTHVLPVVKLTGVTNGMHFNANQNITLSADASDSDDAIASVNFYANSHLVGVATNSPYSVVWTNVPTGLYLLRAVATDQAGDKGYSQSVWISSGVTLWGPHD